MDTSEILKSLRYRIDRITLYKEKFKDWPEFLKELIGDVERLEENHDECYSQDHVSDRVYEETKEYRTEIEDLKSQIEELSKSRRPGRRRLSELRDCSRRLSAQIEAVESLQDGVAYRLNRTERYTPEWDDLEPRYERLKAQRRRLGEWQREIETQIDKRKRKGGAA